MTFCCRPSKNCLRCRQRRIKCDRVKPACSQCRRAGKECEGYREELSLLFRDENARTIRRAKAAKERSLLKDRKAEQQSQTTSPKDVGAVELGQGGLVVMSKPLPPSSTDIDNYGLQFFFHHFCTVPWVDGRLPYGHQLHMFQNLDIEAPFRNSVTAVGLAAMSNVLKNRALLEIARMRYGETIRAVRMAMNDPSQQDLGEVLKMIVMLAIFQMVDAKAGALSSWTVHITGVAALLRRYPFPRREQPNVQAELLFFFGVIMKYFQVGGPFPSELDLWPIQRKMLISADTWPAFFLIDIFIKFIRLCVTLSTSRETEAEEVLCTALVFEAELQAWMNSLPENWNYVTEKTTHMQKTFYGQYHVYQDAWSSRVLNHYRLGRLLVNEVILEYIRKLREPGPEWIEQKEQSLRIVNQMATDICIGSATQALFTDGGVAPSSSLPSPLLKGIFMVIYPLTVAASATGVSKELRNWVIQTLHMVGNTMGIRQAIEVIPQLQRAGANQTRIPFWPRCPLTFENHGLEHEA